MLAALAGSDEDVGGLDVTMDETAGMSGVERVGDPGQEADHTARGEGTVPGDERVEVRAFDVAHGQEELALGLAGLEDGHDVGVVDRGREARLREEPGAELGIGGDLRREELEGDLAVERLLRGQPDRAHAAAAEQPLEPVARQEGAFPDLGHAPDYPGGRKAVADQRPSRRSTPSERPKAADSGPGAMTSSMAPAATTRPPARSRA